LWKSQKVCPAGVTSNVLPATVYVIKVLPLGSRWLVPHPEIAPSIAGMNQCIREGLVIGHFPTMKHLPIHAH
jgi:hypothetical protein